MSTLEQIEAAILSLPLNDFEKLRHWFFDMDYQRWDEQLKRDIAEGDGGDGGDGGFDCVP